MSISFVLSNLELSSQLPRVTLGQGEGVLGEDVGQHQEQLHVRHLEDQ